MKNMLVFVLVSVLGLLGILGLGWVFMGNDFFMMKFFAPKYEQVRRETFEQTKSYNQGMVQELQNMQFEYLRSAPEQKLALRSIILHRAADYDVDRLPPDLASFINDLRRQKEMGK